MLDAPKVGTRLSNKTRLYFKKDMRFCLSEGVYIVKTVSHLNDNHVFIRIKKSVGSAVVRNLIKRRVRSFVRQVCGAGSYLVQVYSFISLEDLRSGLVRYQSLGVGGV